MKQITVERYLAMVNRHRQTQMVLRDQLYVLTLVANKLGLYDAADYLDLTIKQKKDKI